MTNAIENFICSKCNKIIKNGQICFLYEGEKLFCVKCYFQVLNTEKQNCDDKLKYLKEEINNNCVDGKDYDNLKQQLAEKDKEIHSLIVDYEKRISQEQELMSNLEKELTELKEKDNYHLRYELAGADETITNLRRQLEEKDKEIERLKVFEKVYYQNQIQASQETINKLLQSAYQSPIAIGLNQIAITELEKVKNFVDGRTYCADYINKRIQELKGE